MNGNVCGRKHSSAFGRTTAAYVTERYIARASPGGRALSEGPELSFEGDASRALARVMVADLLIDNLNLSEAVALLDRALARGARGYVVTPNVDHVVQYQRDAAFRAACDGAALRLPDSVPLVWASRLLGQPLRARVAGADLVPALCEMAAVRGHTVFLFGGRRDVAGQAAQRLAARFPRLRVAGTYTPPEEFEPAGPSAEAAVRAVNLARPALLFVGLGTPKQELWVNRYWDRLEATVVVCCGAAIDYAAGVQVRAPGWMQRAGLEWVWRLGHEPRRLWKRYLVRDAAFVGILLKEWWRRRIRAFRT